MNFEQNKFGHPFNGGNQYFNQLSARIQQRAGIDVIKMNDHVEPKIEFTKKQKQMPVQLTVEFGFPLTAEKIEKEEVAPQDLVKPVENNLKTKSIKLDNHQDVIKSDLGEIHIEPLNVQPNATPYWHEFNADDELEGLVLDSEGQEMSDITITGDGVFDLDQQIFHEISPKSSVETQIVDEVIETISPLSNIDEVNFESSELVNQTDISNEINNALISLDATDEFLSSNIEIQNEINQSEIKDETNSDIVSSSIIDNGISSATDIQDVSINPDVVISADSSLVNHNEELEISLATTEIPSFSFSFIPEIEPIIETTANEIPTVEAIAEIPTFDEITSNAIVDINSETVVLDQVEEALITAPAVEAIIETPVKEAAAPGELSFSEIKVAAPVAVAETKESIQTETAIPELEFSDADLDMLHNQMANESNVAYVKSSAGSTVNIPVFEDATEETANPKLTWMDLIPWSSVFGVVASLMAIAAAWFIWNSIQKPMAIDEFIDKAVVASPANQSVVEAAPIAENLSPEEYIATSIIEDATVGNSDETSFNFSELSERSRVSAVELEKLGLTSLNLEDPFFEESIF